MDSYQADITGMSLKPAVAFILVKGALFLVEKRWPDDDLEPGKICIPGGHVEAGESRLDALHRELQEELGIQTDDVQYVCTLADGGRNISYYAIRTWEGKLENREAEELSWLRLDNSAELDSAVDITAISEFAGASPED